MRKSLLAALMAASVLVPAAASAQDNQNGRGDRHGRGDNQPQQARAEHGENRGGGERPQRDFARPQPQAQPQPQVQQQARPQFNPAGREGRGPYQGGRPDFRGNTAAQAQQAQPQVQQAPQQARPQRQPDARGGFERSGDRGLTAQPYRGGDDRQAGNRDRRGYDNRDDRARGDGNRNDRGRGYDQRGNAYGGYTGGYGNRAWSRDWRRDNRYDYSAYRSQNRAIYHLPRYYVPYGWNYGYRRFSIGFTLSSFLYDQDYWIDEPDYYRLPPAYGPYRWVRYYDDALLVDLRTGYVVDTVYDIFW